MIPVRMHKNAILSALALTACATASKPSDSAPQLTLRYGAHPAMLTVVNRTSASLEFGASPTNDLVIPTPALGIWMSLGTIPPGIHCVALPDSMFLNIGGAGGPMTTTLIWTSSVTMRMFTVDTIPSFADNATRLFVPDSAAGWRVSVPNSDGTIVAAAPCTA